MCFPEISGNLLSLNSFHSFFTEKRTHLLEQLKRIPIINDSMILFVRRRGRNLMDVTIDTSRITKNRVISFQNLNTNSSKHSCNLLQTCYWRLKKNFFMLNNFCFMLKEQKCIKLPIMQPGPWCHFVLTNFSC